MRERGSDQACKGTDMLQDVALYDCRPIVPACQCVFVCFRVGKVDHGSRLLQTIPVTHCSTV